MAAWNIKEDDKRVPDQIPNFIIFCEDDVSEVLYLRAFQTPRIKINPIGKQKSDFDNVTNAIEHCQKNGLMIVDAEHNEKLNTESAFVWCVYDRDIQRDVSRDKRLIAFDESIQLAERKGFEVAWSNDSFELWILLHFEEVDPTQETNATREQYYDRLTHTFLARKSKNTNLLRVQAEPTFRYKTFLKTGKNFPSIVLKEIEGLTSTAIARAERLEAHHNIPDRRPHQKAPCTRMHHLVNVLLKYGQANTLDSRQE